MENLSPKIIIYDKEIQFVNDYFSFITEKMNGIKKMLQSSSGKLKIEDFDLPYILGKGTFGKVYMAKHKTTGERVAIKILDKKFLIKHGKIHECFIERIVLSQLNHPNIIKLYSSFQDSKNLYFVLELMENKDLRELIKCSGTLDTDTTRIIIAQLVNALDYLRSKGMSHRDIKPENVTLDEHFRVKLIDFSTVHIKGKMFDRTINQFVESTETEEISKESLVGTAEYIAPECLENNDVSFAGDIWSLGCILYMCLHGRTPFNSNSQHGVFEKILKTNELVIDQKIDETAADLIRKILQRDPSMRLGAGDKDSCNGMQQLKDHEFFDGIPFDKLDSLNLLEISKFRINDINNGVALKIRSLSENFSGNFVGSVLLEGEEVNRFCCNEVEVSLLPE